MVHCFVPLIDVPSHRDPQISKKRKRAGGDAPAGRDGIHPSGIEQEAQAESDDSDNLPRDFPHAPLKDPDAKRARQTTKQRNFKTHHFHVLNTVLHRCLLDHDYERAGKAFALLLRYEISGRQLDLRRRGLWGIGAEILLRTAGSDEAFPSLDEDDVPSTEQLKGDSDYLEFSEAGFNAARSFYDRLIIQFPVRKTAPSAISAQDFYPAMFGVWIFQVRSASRRARQRVTRSQPGILSALSDVDSEVEGDEHGANDGALIIAARTEELRRAREISSALTDLTLGPPYDRHPGLLSLQGRIQLWVADLVKAVSGPIESEVAILLEGARRSLRRAADHGAKLTVNELELIDRELSTASSP